MNTIVIVTMPDNLDEARAALLSYRQFMAEEFDFLIITEGYRVKEVRASLDSDERVIGMWELDPRIERLTDGYSRQMAAKLLASRAIKEGEFVLFTDDDVLAMARFNSETFTDQHGRPVIFYRREKVHPWCFGQNYVFGVQCARRFQLSLPYAQSLESLRGLAANEALLKRCFEWWNHDQGLSEFQVMGEYEVRNRHGRDIFRRADHSGSHWTNNLGTFRDWQGEREYLRIYLSQTGQTPASD